MNDLNFFSIYQGSTKERNTENTYIYIATAVVALIILVTSGFYAVKIYTIGNSIEDYTNKLNDPKIQTQLKEAQIINDKLSILGEYEGSLSNVVKAIKSADLIDSEFLIGVSGAVPSGISFQSWGMNGYELNIKGIARTRSVVAELEHNLRILPQFKLVHVNKIEVGSAVGKDLTFDITCIVKEVE